MRGNYRNLDFHYVESDFGVFIKFNFIEDETEVSFNNKSPGKVFFARAFIIYNSSSI